MEVTERQTPPFTKSDYNLRWLRWGTCLCSVFLRTGARWLGGTRSGEGSTLETAGALVCEDRLFQETPAANSGTRTYGEMQCMPYILVSRRMQNKWKPGILKLIPRAVTLEPTAETSNYTPHYGNTQREQAIHTPEKTGNTKAETVRSTVSNKGS